MTAINRYCTCSFSMMGCVEEECEVHKAYRQNQRWLDGLLFMRRQRDWLLKEEWFTG